MQRSARGARWIAARVIAVSSAVLLLIVAVLVVATPATALDTPVGDCSGDMVFQFPAGDRRLVVSSSLERGPFDLGFTLEPGVYDVVAESWDGLSKDQPNEQWKFALLNAAGATVVVSPPTLDVPDDGNFITTRFRLEVPEAAGTVVALHAQLGDPTVKNSVDALCIGFAAVAPPVPGVGVVKLTNGVDAALVAVGAAVTWTYEVTNVGNEGLVDVVVMDAVLAPVGVAAPVVACPGLELAVGASMTCQASGVALDLGGGGGVDGGGEYVNEVTTTAVGLSSGLPVTATTTSTYTNPGPPPEPDEIAIGIEKHTNGRDADHPTDADVPRLEAGDAITWTYEVTNLEEETLVGIVVTDAVTAPLGTASPTVECPTTELAAGESMTCTATGTALDLEPDEHYANVATATGTGVTTGRVVSAHDSSSYLPVTGIETATLAIAGLALSMFGGGVLVGTGGRGSRPRRVRGSRSPP